MPENKPKPTQLIQLTKVNVDISLTLVGEKMSLSDENSIFSVFLLLILLDIGNRNYFTGNTNDLS